MAIKGKGRTRARPMARAPKREAVPVPLPWVRRRWVQMLAAFLAGLLVFWGAIWLTNGIRDERNSSEQASQSLERRRAGTAWQSMIGTELGKIGGQHELGSPPIVFPQMRSTLADLANGTPEDAAASLRQIATQSKAMADAVQKYALSESLADKGFDKGSVLRFLSARDELTTAMTLFREAALLGAAATKLDPKDRAEVIGRAQSLVVQAQAALQRFETHQIEALSAAGIHPTNPALPGLPGS
jgi:hypothetical protein